jgi:hypothetical protein
MERIILALCLASSISLATQATYAVTPVNSMNDSQLINGGTYTNTADGVTTFKNSAGTGLWLQKGNYLRGVEVDSSGKMTNNGGTVHIYAPGQVVRLDGEVDVRSLQDGNKVYLGNGGKVFVDAAYLYQKGNIYASGANGGLVQFNVGAVDIRSGSIDARGHRGTGGVIAINSGGPVYLAGLKMDTSGKTSANFDTNVIDIEGGTIVSGTALIADGVSDRGGIIRLVASGRSDTLLPSQAVQKASAAGMFTGSEQNSIILNLSDQQMKQIDGSIGVRATISAQGTGASIGLHNDPSDVTSRAGDGGTIQIVAQKSAGFNSVLYANGAQSGTTNNGGNGGTIIVTTGDHLTNGLRMTANGGSGLNGGSGGLLAFDSSVVTNVGIISANGGNATSSGGHGGNGGLIVNTTDNFSGYNSQFQKGTVVTYGGQGQDDGLNGLMGSIVTVDPTKSGNILLGTWRKVKPIELLSHAENVILFSNERFKSDADVPANNLRGCLRSPSRGQSSEHKM